MRRGCAGTLVAAALVTLAVPARALADESLTPTGSITYTWQGDPARGCAAAGLCGVRGEVIVRPEGGMVAIAFRGTIDVAVFSPTLIVRATGPGGVCVDAPTGPNGGDLFITRGRHGGLVGRIEPFLSSGRCAGPTAQDLARLTFPVRRIGRRRPSFDVRGRRSFGAGPFTGTVTSTLVLRPSTGGGGFSSSSGTFSAPPPAGVPRHKILFERVTLRYRMQSLPSALTALFSGEPDPFCAALASCGAAGTLALSVPRFTRTFTVTAEREVATRLSSRRAIADLRRGVLPLNAGPPIAFSAGPPVQVNETLRAGDGSSCQAASTTRQAQVMVDSGLLAGSRHAVQVVLSDPNETGIMRTYCPGPDDNDMFGRSTILARTNLGREQLLRRNSVFALSRSGTFAGSGYGGTLGGALRFSLILEHVRAGTVQEVVP
jgi:hypothetical protein